MQLFHLLDVNSPRATERVDLEAFPLHDQDTSKQILRREIRFPPPRRGRLTQESEVTMHHFQYLGMFIEQ